MADKEKVEKFRLTKDQVSFQRMYKKLLGIGKVLHGKVVQNMNEQVGLQDMMQQVTGGLQLLQQQAPKSPIQELEGQDPKIHTPTTGGVRN